MVIRTLVKNGQKKNTVVVMYVCVLSLTIALLPNISWAFTSATAEFDNIGVFTVLQFGQNVNQPATASASTSGGASAQRADFANLFIQISLNDNIPLLFVNCADGTHIKEVTINFGGDFDGSIYSIKLTNVMISSFDWSEYKDFSGLSIGLSYGRIEWTYGGVTTGWDLQKNEAIDY